MTVDSLTQMYEDETTVSNEAKGFMKTFQKRTKDKKVEDKDVQELLSFQREGKILLGSKITEKSFKRGVAKKVFTASNCDEMTLSKINHYAKIAGVEVVNLDLDNGELAQKLAKPFLISMVCIKG